MHGARAADVAVADMTQLPELMHGCEREVFGDRAYRKKADRRFPESRGMHCRINRRPTSRRPLSGHRRMIKSGRELPAEISGYNHRGRLRAPASCSVQNRFDYQRNGDARRRYY